MPYSPEKYLYEGWDLVRLKTSPNSYMPRIPNVTCLIKDKLNLNHGTMITKDVKTAIIIGRDPTLVCACVCVCTHCNVYNEDLASSF